MSTNLTSGISTPGDPSNNSGWSGAQNTLVEREALDRLSTLLTLEPQALDASLAQLAIENPELHAKLAQLLSARHWSSQPMYAGIERSFNTELPDAIGSFKIKEEIGRGGMGVVLLGERDLGGTKQSVAIKVFPYPFSAPSARARFAFERETIAKLEHPHIARLIDGGEANFGLWYAMELVQGQDLLAFAKANQLDLAARLNLLIALCSAVHYAHQHLILHRDIKPNNILVTVDGQLKLIDFGIAKAIDAATSLTQEVTPMTPRFAAPEQLKGMPASVASDVWQIGLVAYELLSGALPNVSSELHVSKLSESVDWEALALKSRTREYRKGLRGNADAIVSKTLRVNAADRYQSVADLMQDLQTTQNNPNAHIEARRSERFYRTRLWFHRHRWASAFAAMGLLAIVIGTISTLRFAQQAQLESNNNKAMNSVLLDLFLASDEQMSQDSASLTSFYTAGVKRLLSEQRLEPASRIELLSQLSRQAMHFDAIDTGTQGFNSAIAQAERVHGLAHPKTSLLRMSFASELLLTGGKAELAHAKRIAAPAVQAIAIATVPNNGELAVAAAYWDYLLAMNEKGSGIEVLAAQERRIAVKTANPPYPLRNQFDDRMHKAKLLSDLGRNVEAEQIVRAVLTEVEKNQARTEIQSYMSYLRADACGMLQRVSAADALSYCEKALEIAVREKSLDSVDGYYLRQTLGILYMLSGKREAALASYEDGLRILRAVEGTNTRSYRASEMMTAVGMGYTVMGKPEQGVQMLSEACSIKLQHFGPQSGNAAICHIYLAKTYYKLNRLDEAKAAIERVTAAIKDPELRSSTRDDLLAMRATLKLAAITP